MTAPGTDGVAPARLSPRPTEVVDRNTIIEVTVNDQRLSGFAGDTAASLCLAHGRRTFFGSVHEQRPGGPRRADWSDHDAWVWVDGLGLVPAAAYRLRPGETLSMHQRRASTPSATAPGARVARVGRGMVERVAAVPATRLGQLPRPQHPPWLASLRRHGGGAPAGPAARRTVELLVVGGGLAGLGAALAAADHGASVLLVEADGWLGGCTRWAGDPVAQTRLDELVAAVRAHPAIEVVLSAVVAETTPGGAALVVVRETEHGIEHESVWAVTAGAVVLAHGTIERSIPFRGNHLPGVMVATGARRLLQLWAVRPGERALVVADGRRRADGDALAGQLTAAGVEVADVVVLAESAGYLGADGDLSVEEVQLPDGRLVAADLLVTSFGAVVDGSLVGGLGGVVTRRPDTGALVVGELPATAAVVGSLAGLHEVEQALVHATATGQRLAGLGRGRGRRQRVAPPPAPALLAGTEPIVPRPVSGIIDAEADLRVEQVDGFAASLPAAMELLVATARRPGLTPTARLQLAELSRSATASAPLDGLILAGGALAAGPTLGALAMLGATPARRSPLADLHVQAGARLVPSDGWQDVWDYGDPPAERAALGGSVGVRDASCEGWFEVAGPAAATVLAAALGVDAAALAVGATHQADGVLLVRTGGAAWQVLVPCGRASEVQTRLWVAALDHQPWEAVVLARNEDEVRLRLRGPATVEVLESLGVVPEVGRRRPMQVGDLAGHVLARDDTDVELHVPADAGRGLWAAVLGAGERQAICPVGIAAMAASDDAAVDGETEVGP